MDNFIIFFLIIFMIFCVFMMANDKDKKEKAVKNEVREKFAALDGNQESVKKFENILPNGTGIAGDADGNLLIVRQGVATPIRVPGSQVAEVSLVINNITEAKTVNKGGITRAVVGGAFFGGTGAVVGALTSGSKTTSSEKINEIKVEVVVIADEGFTYEHVLLARGAYASSNDTKRLLSEGKVLKAQIDDLVNLSNSKKMNPFGHEEISTESSEEKDSGMDVGDKFDKLKKLGDLYKSGLLNEDEFLSEKSKLLES